MNAAGSIAPPIDAADRLAATFCFALIIHVMIILGVSFMPHPRPPAQSSSLDITLVTAHSATKPQDAKVLAQANLEGGGDTTEKVRPSTPIAAPIHAPLPALAVPDAVPAPGPLAEEPTATAAAVEPPSPAPSAPAARPKPQPVAPPRVATRSDPPKARLPAPAPTPVPAPVAAVADAPPQPEAPAGTEADTPPTAAQLITRSFALASMSSELQDKLEARAQRPRTRYISASTQEYRYAAYMEAWRAKVERIGNINYPDDARDGKLSGSLLLDVSLRPDGSVIDIVVRRSSGHQVLDDGAVRIVQLAGPYAPFPPDIAREIDVLHVTRVWRFLNSAEFTAQ